MAGKKSKKRTTQNSLSAENGDTAFVQNMAALAISGDLPLVPYHPQNPPQQLQRDKKQKRDIVIEFDRYFGEVTKLENWQRLCSDIGLPDDLTSLTQCKKVFIILYSP